MRNRSISKLPSFYAAAGADDLNNRTGTPYPLELFDITFLHFHSALELGMCASGRGCCVVQDREYPFEAGDVQIVFPFQSHLSRSEGGEYSRWYWTSLNPMQLLGAWGAPELPRLEKLLYTRMGLCGIIDRARYPLIASLIARVVLPGDRRRRTACLCALIEELAAESEGLEPLQLRPERAFERMEPALLQVQTQLDAGRMPAVSELASACALSPAAFRRAFRLALGQSPQQYIQNCQLQKAQRMLLFTDESITQIALSLGYQDVSGFNRIFLRAFGVAPRKYRETGGEA